MRVRRALAIAITTPVLLATIGTTGASAAATPHRSTIEAQGVGDDEKDEEDEMTPEEAAAYSFANDLFNRFASREGAKMQTRTLDKSGTNQL
jgi:hypothetical protein